jgi:hypothetical protein
MQPNALLIWQQNIYDCKKSGVTLIEVQIDATAANGDHWVAYSMLVAALSNFLELKSELDLLGSGRSADLIED